MTQVIAATIIRYIDVNMAHALSLNPAMQLYNGERKASIMARLDWLIRIFH